MASDPAQPHWTWPDLHLSHAAIDLLVSYNSISIWYLAWSVDCSTCSATCLSCCVSSFGNPRLSGVWCRYRGSKEVVLGCSSQTAVGVGSVAEAVTGAVVAAPRRSCCSRRREADRNRSCYSKVLAPFPYSMNIRPRGRSLSPLLHSFDSKGSSYFSESWQPYLESQQRISVEACHPGCFWQCSFSSWCQ